MKAIIKPSEIKNRTIQLPPSKSLAHRAIICASLAKGSSRIDNIDYSMDILATLDAMEVLGAKIVKGKDYVLIEGTDLSVQKEDMLVDCNESGSTLRFLIPLFSLCNTKVTFTGKDRLMQRPQGVYEKTFSDNQTPLVRKGNELIVDGAICPGIFHVRGDVSSQFISGLLFALPLLDQDSVIVIEGPYESESYVSLTIDMLKKFGITVKENGNQLMVPGNQHYKSADLTIESDFSQLAFFASLGVLCGPLKCGILNPHSLQGDRAFVKFIEQMNGKVTYGQGFYTFDVSDLKGIEIDLSDCPDLGPALIMLASFAQGTTRICNAGRLRIKESDRIEAMETELRKCGVEIHSDEDTIWVNGKTGWHPSIPLYGHNDHRIVMALAIGAACSRCSVIIEGAEAVSKSYPGFFDDLSSLGVSVQLEQNERV